jgi:transcriptional regulator with XRE-family HTH domain
MSPNRIHSIRKSAGLTQEQLGQLMGVRQSQVSQWEQGNRSIEEPQISMMRRLEERQQEQERWEKTKERLLRAAAAGGVYLVLDALFSDEAEEKEEL